MQKKNTVNWQAMEKYVGKRRNKKRVGLYGHCQLTVAVFLTLAGVVLLFLGFYSAPEGQIHNSVLIGFGEVATFAGALFGVDYSYRIKYSKHG